MHNSVDCRLGLCCINSQLRKHKIFCSRSTTLRLYSKQRATCLASQNLANLCELLEWNANHKIQVFRLSSEMFPRITDTQIDLSERLKISDFKQQLEQAGCVAKTTQQRITMHPGQYNQVGAKTRDVFDQTCLDLEIHSEILDTMGMDDNAILTVHGGGLYGDKESTIRRWIEQFSDLSPTVKRRLAIENCERAYNIEDCLYISHECKIPVIFDSHHFDCYNKIYSADLNPTDYIEQILQSWGSRRMVCHISEQRPDTRIGAHSDYIDTIPPYLLDIPEKYNTGIDIEVEAKAKEMAIFKLWEKYPTVH